MSPHTGQSVDHRNHLQNNVSSHTGQTVDNRKHLQIIVVEKGITEIYLRQKL